MKYILLFFLIISSPFLKAQTQKIESIYVNLYTDSLKRGTYNYINVDGLLSNGSYLPLDSTHIIFKSSEGKFTGNSLWLDSDFAGKKITIKVSLRENTELYKEFDMYIKQKQDGPLKTVDELMSEMKNRKQKKKDG